MIKKREIGIIIITVAIDHKAKNYNEKCEETILY
jgi:hypothetical protein